MKLKRVTAILLAGVMAMGLVACGSGSDTAADTTTSTSTATGFEEISGPGSGTDADFI